MAMRKGGLAVCVAALLVVVVGVGQRQAVAQEAGAADGVSYVVALRGEQARVFTAEEDRFRRSEAQLGVADLSLPARVLGASGRGYYQVETPQGPVWLDRFDVVVDPPLVISARCLAVSTPDDTTSGITRGAGEECR